MIFRFARQVELVCEAALSLSKDKQGSPLLRVLHAGLPNCREVHGDTIEGSRDDRCMYIYSFGMPTFSVEREDGQQTRLCLECR